MNRFETVISGAYFRAPVNTATIIGFTITSVISFTIVFAILYFGGRDRKFVGSNIEVVFGNDDASEEIVPLISGLDNVVEFVPLKNIPPGIFGILISDRVNKRDLVATIIDLAMRGYLSIEVDRVSKSKNVCHYILTENIELHGDQKLLTFESKLLEALFSNSKTVNLADLTHQQCTSIYTVRKEMYKEVVKRGWFESPPDNERRKWGDPSLYLMYFVAIMLIVFFARKTSVTFSLLPILFAIVTFHMLSSRIVRRTAHGFSVKGRVLGFKKIFDIDEDMPVSFASHTHNFQEYLPYAIVFGYENKWANVFDSNDITEIPNMIGLANVRNKTLRDVSQISREFIDSASNYF